MATPAETERPAQGGLLRLLAIGFGIAAIVKELRLAKSERTWH